MLKNTVAKLARIANALDQHTLYAEADIVTKVAARLAQIGPEDQPFSDPSVIDDDFNADQGFLGNDDEAALEGADDLLGPEGAEDLGATADWNPGAFDSDWESKAARIETLLSQEMLTPEEEAEFNELTKGLGDMLSSEE